MKDYPRLLRQAFVLYCCITATLAAAFLALVFLLLWLSPASDLAVATSLVGAPVLLLLLPWLGLSYIFASKRFPVQWHWLISTIAALAATQGLRLLPSTFRLKPASQIQSVCSAQPGEMIELPNLLHCASTAWSALVQGAIIDAATAGAVLIAAAWALNHHRRTQA
ncbi:hypothetical protein WNB94_17010 [Aquabacterium sp. A3]|uniref:hypothetical protein n=1 Tax=Aquabacterium sp. A3 TaxID=3132829 RepID=UPI0031196A94